MVVDATLEVQLAAALNVSRYPKLVWLERRELGSGDDAGTPAGSIAVRVPDDFHGFSTPLIASTLVQFVDRQLHGALPELTASPASVSQYGGGQAADADALEALLERAAEEAEGTNVSLAVIADMHPALRGSALHRGMEQLADAYARSGRGIPARFAIRFHPQRGTVDGRGSQGQGAGDEAHGDGVASGDSPEGECASAHAGSASAHADAGAHSQAAGAPSPAGAAAAVGAAAGAGEHSTAAQRIELPRWAVPAGWADWEVTLHRFRPDGGSDALSARQWLASRPPRLAHVLNAVRGARVGHEGGLAAGPGGSSAASARGEAAAPASDTEAAEFEAVIGAFVRARSRPLAVAYSDLSARVLFEDELTRFHLVALLPGAWATPGGRASAFAEAELERVTSAASALPPPRSSAAQPTLPEHADSARAQLQEAARALLVEAAGALEGEAVGVLVDASEHPAVLAFYGVKRAALPAFLALDTNRTKAMPILPDRALAGLALPTVNALVSAVRSFASGELRAAVRSEPAPEPMAAARSAVCTLVGSTFAAAAHNPALDVAVLFHAPWCAHCAPLRTRWAELARAHDEARDGGLRLCEMSMPANEAEGLPIFAFPTIALFAAAEARPAERAREEADPRLDASTAADALQRPAAKRPVFFEGADRSAHALEAFIAQNRRTIAPLGLLVGDG